MFTSFSLLQRDADHRVLTPSRIHSLCIEQRFSIHLEKFISLDISVTVLIRRGFMSISQGVFNESDSFVNAMFADLTDTGLQHMKFQIGKIPNPPC